MTRQNGQPVAIFSAPVPSASSTRSRLTRLPIFSSIHMRAPPAPQQNERSAAAASPSAHAGGPDELTWLVVDLVVPAQVARVVIGAVLEVADGLLDPASRPSRTSALSSWVWCTTSYWPPSSRILRPVEAVGASGDDLARAGRLALEDRVEDLDALRRYHLEHALFLSLSLSLFPWLHGPTAGPGQRAAGLLRHTGWMYAVLGPEESCTGDPARRSGNEFVFQMLAAQNVEVLNTRLRGPRTRHTKIVTTCPHCFNTLGREYPQLDGHYEVVHHTAAAQRAGRGRAARPGRGARRRAATSPTTTPATWAGTTRSTPSRASSSAPPACA